MISRQVIKSGASYAKYLTDQQARVEYYAGQAVPSEWHGNSAEIAGLKGAVDQEAFANALAGKVREYDREAGQWQETALSKTTIDKETGERIQNHRAGYDFTFSPEKSWSIAAGVFGAELAEKIFRESVDDVMQLMQTEFAEAVISIDGVKESRKTGNLCWATFLHMTSREGDSQMHIHAALMNLTHYDGKAYSLNSEAIFKFGIKNWDQIFNAALAHRAQQNGIEVVRDAKGVTKLAQYDGVDLSVMSKRSAQIEAEVEKHGQTRETASYEALQAANHATRKEKNHVESAEVHRERWQAECKAAGIPEYKPPTKGPAKTITWADQKADAHKLLNAAKEHETSKEQVVEVKDLMGRAAMFSDGVASIAALHEALSEQIKSGDIAVMKEGRGGFGKAKVTTKEAIQDNETLRDYVHNAKNTRAAIMTEKEFDKAVEVFEARKTKEFGKKFELTSEQRDAAKLILTSKDSLSVIDGKAGTGKTTFAELVKEAAESKGYEVTGISAGGKQAEKLEAETGIKSYTVAKLLNTEEKKLRDADMAKNALETYAKGGSQKRFDTMKKDLSFLQKTGEVSKEYDAAGRLYLRNNETGDLYCAALHKDPNRHELESRNVNHLGLTATKYVVTNDAVFKQGGTLVSELAGKITDKLRKTQSHSATTRLAVRMLSKFENWQKAGVLESDVVRAQAAIEAAGQKRDIINALKKQADPKNEKCLYLNDELSMNSTKDMNRLLDVVEKTGKRISGLGDYTQRESVAAGKAMAHMLNEGVATATLTEISRQKTDQAKEQVATILGRPPSTDKDGAATSRADVLQEAGRERYGKAIRMNKNNVEIKTTQNKLPHGAGKTALKNARTKDNALVIKQIAKDYVVESQKTIAPNGKERKQDVLAITSTNADRLAINAEIRTQMKAAGLLKDGHQITAIRGVDRTEQEQAKARMYQRGELLQFSDSNRSEGIKAGDTGKVTSIDDKTNTITLSFGDGSKRTIDPAKHKGLQSYREAGSLEFSEGDRMTFTKGNTDLNVKNGQMGTVEKFDGKNMTVRMLSDPKQTRTFDVEEYRYVDHGYAVTNFKAQGETVDLGLIHHNTEAGGHGDRETYVNITRVRYEARVYTQDMEKAAVQAGIKMDKTTATPLKEQGLPDDGMAEKLQKADRQTVDMQVVEIQDPRRTGNATKDAQADQALIRQHIARDFADNTNRDKTQIVAGTREDRQQLNTAVRDALKERGMIAKDGVTVQALEKIDRGRSGLSNVANYNKGEAVRFGVDMPGLGLKKGEFATVAGTKDGRLVTVKITDEKGKSRTASFDPKKARSVEVFNKRQIEVSPGDKVLVGNKLATVASASGKSLAVKDETGQTTTHDTKKPLEISHGYAVKADQVAASTTQVKLHIDKAKATDAGKALAAGAGRQTQLYTASTEKALDKLGIKVTPEQQSQRGRDQDKAPMQEQRRQKTAMQIHRETRARRARTQAIEHSR